MMKLENRVAVVTGASQGLGKAIAEGFLREGAHVAICARDAGLVMAEGERLESLAHAGQRVLAFGADVTSRQQIANLFGEIEQQLGPTDILVNNAGVYGPKGLSAEVDLDEWVRAVEINLLGTFLPSRHAIDQMRRNGRGKIINLSGGGATNPLPRFSAYAASKAAVVRLTETLAEELRDLKIDVNAVAPGALNTRFLDEVLQAGPETVGETFYQKATKQKQDGGAPMARGVALCVYLASPVSDGITGKLLSAIWDPWETLHEERSRLEASDLYTLRRITPADRD